MPDASQRDDLSADAVMGQVVDDFLDRLQRGERPEVEDYVRRHPQLAAILRQMLPALELVRVAPTDVGPADGAAEPIRPEGPLGDFRLVRELGRGGMGVVYEAVQISLGRRVALKVLPFAAALDARQLQRFKTEAQAAACLLHEHIVPVYGVGCDRGVHYYAMQLIEGQSLAGLLALQRQQPAALTAQTPLPTRADPASRERRPAEPYRQVARLGIDAAEALAHAHERGVIHRDVKPANLLLDDQGKLWVTDFGLAHIQSDAKLTMTGDLLGTLRYMAPEQALGQPSLIGPRSDVYSLGVTLYELLTLRPAFPGDDRQELLRQISSEEAIPPRLLDRSIPADLETIVLKAMAKEPADRYATAGELADDLRRFLDDRPVRARRPTLVQRLGKWARRHRAVVRAAAAGLAVAFLVLAASSLLLARAYRAESRSRQDAEDKLALARKAINDWYTKFGRLWVNDEPDLEQEQIAHLLEAVKLFEVLAREDGGPRQRADAGAAYVQLAEVRNRLGHVDRAEADLRTALSLLDPDRAEPADRDAVRLSRAQALLAMGRLRGDRLPTLEEARALFRTLHEDDPQDTKKAYELAHAEAVVGMALTLQGRGQDAARAFRTAEALLTRLVERNPADARSLGRLGLILAYRAEEVRRTDQAAGRRLLERSIGHLAEATRLEPRLRGHRATMQEKYSMLAELAHQAGDVTAALQAAERAMAVAERLADESPRLPRFRARLAGTAHFRGVYLGVAQRYPEARASHQRSRDLLRDLVRDFPDSGYELLLARSHTELGRVLVSTGRPGMAASEFLQAIRLARGVPRELAVLHRDLGQALALHKEPAAAEQHLTTALDLSRAIAARPDAVPGDRRVQMMATILLAALHHDSGRLAPARRLFEEAAAQGEALVRQFPDTPAYGWGLALAQTGVRKCRARAGEGDAEALWQPTLDLLARLVRLAPDDPTYRQELARQFEERAADLGRAGQTARARESLRRSLATRKALADRLPADPAQRQALAEAYLRAALERRRYGLSSGRDAANEIEDLFRQALSLLEGLGQQADERRDAVAGRAARRLLAQANYGLGTHLVVRGGAHAEAIRRLGRAIDLYSALADGDPRNQDLLSQLSASHHNLGVVLGQVKRFADADAALGEALDIRRRLQRLAPGEGKYDKALAETQFALALTAAALGQHSRAMEHGREALRLQPAHPAMNLYFAQRLLDCPDESQRDPARAAVLARAAIAGDRNTPLARRVLARALFRASRWQEARDLFAAVARVQPVPDDYFYLAMAEWHLKDHAAARQWLQRGEAAMARNREDLQKRRDQRAVRALFELEAEAKKLVTPAATGP